MSLSPGNWVAPAPPRTVLSLWRWSTGFNEGPIETPMVVMPLVDRIGPDNIFDIKFVTLLHSTVIGAAGSSILKAEAAVVEGLIQTGYRMGVPNDLCTL